MSAETASGIELPHRGVVQLLEQMGDQIIRHIVTGEKVQLPQGEWSLHFHPDSGFAYLHNAASVATLWVSPLLRASVWDKDGARTVHWKTEPTPGGAAVLPREVFTLAEWRRRRTVAYPNFTVDGGTYRGKIFIMQLPEHGARVFWSAEGIAATLGLGGGSYRSKAKWIRNFMDRSRDVLKRAGVPPSHVQYAKTQDANVSGTELCLSTRAVVAALVQWSATMREPENRQKCSELLRGIFASSRYGIIAFPMRLADAHGRTYHGSIAIRGQLVDLSEIAEVYGAAALMHLVGLPGNATSARATLGSVDVVRFMHCLFRKKKDDELRGHFFAQVVCAIAHCLEELQPEWEEDPLLGASVSFNRRCDPELRQAVAENLVKQRAIASAYKVHKIAGAIGKKLHKHRAEDDDRAAYRLWLATRRLSEGAYHLAIAPDAGRVAGKERLVAPMVNPAKCQAAWAPPQVRWRFNGAYVEARRSKKEVPKRSFLWDFRSSTFSFWYFQELCIRRSVSHGF